MKDKIYIIDSQAAKAVYLIDVLVEIRRETRRVGNWEIADYIRDRLLAIGSKVKDKKVA